MTRRGRNRAQCLNRQSRQGGDVQIRSLKQRFRSASSLARRAFKPQLLHRSERAGRRYQGDALVPAERSLVWQAGRAKDAAKYSAEPHNKTDR
jgi:hypothetical protein